MNMGSVSKFEVMSLRNSHIMYILHLCEMSNLENRIGGVLVCVLAQSFVDREFEPRSGQTKEENNGICCFSAMHAALRRKSKDWLARNQNNVSEWTDIVLSVSQHYKNPTQRVGLEQRGPHDHLIKN